MNRWNLFLAHARIQKVFFFKRGPTYFLVNAWIQIPPKIGSGGPDPLPPPPSGSAHASSHELLNVICHLFSLQWQWTINKGRCGVCGDRYGGIEDHSDHGKFASGIIVRKYKEGHYINITFEVSSNYLGYVEFRMCPRNSTASPLTQSCFDLYPLWIDEAHGTRYYIGSRGGIYDIHIRLPGGLVCRKCVLQWKYKTGNLIS